MPRNTTTLVTAALIACAGSSAHGQERDTTATRLREAPLAGSARVGLLAAYEPRNGSWGLGASNTVAPFVNEHLQLGIEPSFSVLSAAQVNRYGGGLGVLANYLFRDGNVSRPYVGVSLSGSGATGAPGATIVGVQAGWLRFLTPSIAFRTELSYRRLTGGFNASPLTDLTITLDPYLFGRANERLTTLPGRGAVDVTGIIQLAFQPQGNVVLQGTVAPFLAQWLQPGLTFAYAGSGSPTVELFGRGYLPLATRFAPFADLFGTANSGLNSHGARAGFRSYLTRGVALDLDWEWRNYDISAAFNQREQHTLRASLMTQFGSPR